MKLIGKALLKAAPQTDGRGGRDHHFRNLGEQERIQPEERRLSPAMSHNRQPTDPGREQHYLGGNGS